MFDRTKVAQLLMGVQPYLFLLFPHKNGIYIYEQADSALLII